MSPVRFNKERTSHLFQEAPPQGHLAQTLHSLGDVPSLSVPRDSLYAGLHLSEALFFYYMYCFFL